MHEENFEVTGSTEKQKTGAWPFSHGSQVLTLSAVSEPETLAIPIVATATHRVIDRRPLTRPLEWAARARDR